MAKVTVPGSASSDTAASQAEMEAASSTSVFSSPSRQKYHPGMAKAWVSFDGSGTVTILASYNVSSITDNGSADFTTNFTTAFSSDAYCSIGCLYPNASTYGQVTFAFGVTVKTSSSTCRHRTTINAGFADPDMVDIRYYGDQ